jgi:cell division protein ZipA
MLPPLRLPPLPPQAEEPGPHPGTQFVVDLLGSDPVNGERASAVLLADKNRAALDFPRVWGRPSGHDEWVPLHPAHPTGTRFSHLALCWDLTARPGEDAPALARDLGTLVAVAAGLAHSLGQVARARDTPEQAAIRALGLRALRERFGRSVEVRLVPPGRPFAARQVWRAAYALGLRWGDLDLFHWRDAPTGRVLFTLSALGQPGYFLPERAAEGQGVAGIALGFELPRCPAPVDVFERMVVALDFLRQRLNGHPVTSDGRELDADCLDEERDALEGIVADMAHAGLAPGSPEAIRFF